MVGGENNLADLVGSVSQLRPVKDPVTRKNHSHEWHANFRNDRYEITRH
jgi:hypothetical protein